MLQRIVVNPTQIVPPVVHFTAEQRHYLSRVLRLREGDRVIVMDGQGYSWLVQLVHPSHADLQAEILEAIAGQTELPISITLVMALPKGNAFDEVVRQVTELGVSCITPVISDRTLLHPSPQKLERWRRIAQEAAEQSERQIVPTIQEPIPFQEHLKTLPPSELTHSPHYLCVTRYPAPHLFNCLQHTIPHLPHSPPSTSFLSIAIGPEGGWTDSEVEQAIATGYQPVSLGDRILRAVTAPVVALSLIAAVLEK
ncbi:16S rRNA (uracil(1498)-N(3))-methyltransferase [Leptodesmis sp.]|uniref:16S rRNA (uracil(1498)-N(3))-methyltransferase n=1 Tax=Leptodesmis sp. TaxID=3100501 RepID=UPI0040534752